MSVSTNHTQNAANNFEGLDVMNDESNTVGGTAAAVNG